MPRQNRVTPLGTFEATPLRGAFMGNRGDLHRTDGTIGPRRWQHPHWVCCVLETGKSYRAPFDTPGRYTPLFFHDEAVALAAGHRPCAQCRRADFNRFVAGWEKVHGLAPGSIRVGELDAALQAARIDGKAQRRYQAVLESLPDDTFVLDPQSQRPLKIESGGGRPWSHDGYGALQAVDAATTVTVLTPRPIVEVLAAGYLA